MLLKGYYLTPDDRNPSIRSVWFIDNKESISKFITAYQLRRGK